MTTSGLTEDVVEQATLGWFEALGYVVLHGPDIGPGEPQAERSGYSDVVLEGRLRGALARLNPDLPNDALDEAFRQIIRLDTPSLIQNNRAFHRTLVDGVALEISDGEGGTRGQIVRLIDFDNADANDWLVLNQFTVVEDGKNRRPDVVVFVNGLPLAVIELKNAADENATIWSAYNQLQTYKTDIPSLFSYNDALIVSDGLEARVGSLTANKEWFMPWRTIEGEQDAPSGLTELEVLLRGLFDKRRFLDYLQGFIVFDDDGDEILKKQAGYHQFHAVQLALRETVRASSTGPADAVREAPGTYYAKGQPGGEDGDRRVGVVWHTQGSGKSLTMAFYAGRVIRDPAMVNPTIVVITDRNDLDDQLFGTFSRCNELLRQTPIHIESRAELREKLNVASGGIFFTTIQKFLPEQGGESLDSLTARSNVVVIADEAHRSQYGLKAKRGASGELQYGLAKHMRDALPNASYIAFTGTPLELEDKSTTAIFGDYISVYDIQRAVADGATVPIYYENRLAKLSFDQAKLPEVDEEFEEVTEGEDEAEQERLRTKWAALEAIVGSDDRLDMIAKDLTEHWEKRLEAMDGKAMIVCMSRRICVELYDRLCALKPGWHDDDDAKGVLKVVMTGAASDPENYQPHVRNKAGREKMAKRFKNPSDPMKLVIVRDMWLTGFDAPCMHTMYADKPMQGHGLMQAIARVNRVFRDKPGGLVVDYLGLAAQLQKALANYTQSGGTGLTAEDKQKAVEQMQERYEVCCDLFHGFDWSVWRDGKPAERLTLLPAAQEHILGLDDGKRRLNQAVVELSKAFALASGGEEAIRIREDVAFFEDVKAALNKTARKDGFSKEDLDFAIRQIVSSAVASDEVIDIFSAAGLRKPDISILDDEFLKEVKEMPHRNLAVELLQKLLKDEIKTRSRKNIVKSRSFSEMLQQSLNKYHNRAIETAQVIEELIDLARNMREAHERQEELGLIENEVAFYDALAVNESAREVMEDEQLRIIARHLVETIRQNASIDWTVKETVRAKLRVMVRRILRRYGYPPDQCEAATQTVLQQAELIAGSEGFSA